MAAKALISFFEVIKSAFYPYNSYELAIKTSKDLEYLLEQEWGAQGKGLHEKLNWVQEHSRDPLPEDLVRRIRKLATIRNKLIHDVHYTTIENRAEFIDNYEKAKKQLRQVLQSRGKKSTDCVIM